ncbi:hypothetical protein [Parapedobacter sp. 10938]|uniref:hypothetical protein n=1 Tax=Parapedobacter flavus TaxID=3110225 RepID=UPI002DB9BAD4|nr:hypothetical protein [Parapedobacter sp. 10938]MEC3878921.1 hypothetical protein [Parapedobacter sp. 10938]
MGICNLIHSEAGSALAQLDVQAVVVRCSNDGVPTPTSGIPPSGGSRVQAA